MSEASEQEPGGAADGELLPVPARAGGLAPERGRAGLVRGAGSRPVVQGAAAAAGGFLAGAAVVGLVQRRSRRAPALRRAAGPRKLARGMRAAGTGVAAEGLQVLSSQRLLLDVHVLGPPGADS